MTSNINGAIPATNAALVSAVIRQNFATAATEITALQNFTSPSGGISIPPNPIPGGPVQTSRLGFNIYGDATGYHYVANGPGAQIAMVTTDPVGAMAPMSRMAFAMSDINALGPGASAAPEGLFSLVYGPQGSPDGYVVVGSAMDLLPVPPFGGSFVANQTSIAPGISGPIGATSRLGLNLYLGADNNYHYIANGPAAQIALQSMPFGSRVNIAVADVNTNGGGAVVPGPTGILHCNFGPPGSDGTGAYVSVGGAVDLLTVPPYGGSLTANEMIVGPGQAGPIGSTARFGQNMYLATDNTYRYVANGPAGHISMQSTNPNISRWNVAIADVNSAGAGASASPFGVLHVCYGPVGSGGTNAFVVVGGANTIPTTPPPGGSLMASNLFIGGSQILLGAPGSGPGGGTTRALYLAS